MKKSDEEIIKECRDYLGEQICYNENCKLREICKQPRKDIYKQFSCPKCRYSYSIKIENTDICCNLRPKRDVLCQLEKGHNGRHRAVIFWE